MVFENFIDAGSAIKRSSVASEKRERKGKTRGKWIKIEMNDNAANAFELFKSCIQFIRVIRDRRGGRSIGSVRY